MISGEGKSLEDFLHETALELEQRLKQEYSRSGNIEESIADSPPAKGRQHFNIDGDDVVISGAFQINPPEDIKGSERWIRFQDSDGEKVEIAESDMQSKEVAYETKELGDQLADTTQWLSHGEFWINFYDMEDDSSTVYRSHLARGVERNWENISEALSEKSYS